MKRKKRVVVGMSGGVDSSVAVALLKKQGFEVIGITMQLLPKESEHDSACCNISSINDAKRVAYKMEIPHYTINIRDNFKEKVIDYFIDEYLSGQTPNPCVECNRYIKFDELKQKADEIGADYVATGHYVKRTVNHKLNKYYLKKATDPRKDQSYFLYMLTSKQLKSTLFPLGNFHKSEIRHMANTLGLINANKADSQEICFVTKGNYKEFIEEQMDAKLGKVGFFVDSSGKIISPHKGIYNYTIGQRKGLNIQSQEPLYVLKINTQDNSIMVGKKDELETSIIQLHTVTLVNDDVPILGKTFDIKTRYQMTPFTAKVIEKKGSKLTLESNSPQQFVTPGQSGVLYKNEFVIGGGIIENSVMI